MSKERFKELLKDERSESPAPSDNSIKRLFSEIGDELKHQAAAGAHEMAAALFRGDAFVMYGKEGQEATKEPEAPTHGLPPEAKEQEKEHGGMEM